MLIRFVIEIVSDASFIYLPNTICKRGNPFVIFLKNRYLKRTHTHDSRQTRNMEKTPVMWRELTQDGSER